MTTLFCPVCVAVLHTALSDRIQIPLPGSYLIDRIDIRVGHLIFQWTYSSKQKRRQSAILQEKPLQKLVKLSPDPDAVQVHVQQPSNGT